MNPSFPSARTDLHPFELSKPRKLGIIVGVLYPQQPIHHQVQTIPHSSPAQPPQESRPEHLSWLLQPMPLGSSSTRQDALSKGKPGHTPPCLKTMHVHPGPSVGGVASNTQGPLRVFVIWMLAKNLPTPTLSFRHNVSFWFPPDLHAFFFFFFGLTGNSPQTHSVSLKHHFLWSLTFW